MRTQYVTLPTIGILNRWGTYLDGCWTSVCIVMWFFSNCPGPCVPWSCCSRGHPPRSLATSLETWKKRKKRSLFARTFPRSLWFIFLKGKSYWQDLTFLTSLGHGFCGTGFKRNVSCPRVGENRSAPQELSRENDRLVTPDSGFVLYIWKINDA